MAVKPNIKFRVIMHVCEVEQKDGQENLLPVASSACDVTVHLLEYCRTLQRSPGASLSIDDFRAFHSAVLASLNHCGSKIIGWLGMRL